MTEYTVYALSGEIPDEWNHDTESYGEFGFLYESWGDAFRRCDVVHDGPSQRR